MKATELLISGYFDDTLSDAEVAELETLLLSDEEIASLFARLAIVHSAIRDSVAIERSMTDLPETTEANRVGATPAITDPGRTVLGISTTSTSEENDQIEAVKAPQIYPRQSSVPQTRPSRRWPRLAAALLLAAGAALIIVLHQLDIIGPHWQQPIAMGASLNAIWADPASVAVAGTSIKTGTPQTLESGYAELTSPNGLVVVIQGPATFTVEKPGVVTLASGRLTASVPKVARGFTVNAPLGRVVDLGTEFGVAVNSTGEMDVETFRGTVLVFSKTDSAVGTPLPSGFARRVTSSGGVTEILAGTTPFVRPQNFDELKSMPQGTPYERWNAYSQTLRTDPDLVAYYTFEEDEQSPQIIPNLAGSGHSLDGVFGVDDQPSDLPHWEVGRWPQKGAVGFAADSHQHVNMPVAMGGPMDFSRDEQTAAPFTVCAWIFAANPHASQSSILLRGAMDTRQFALELFPDSSIRAWVGSVAIPGSVRSTGNWQFISLVYDPATRAARFYSDGALVGASADAPTRLPETIDGLTIGSRRAGKTTFIPAMPGRVDELAVFRRALSGEQVKAMYQAEKPD